MKNAVKLLILLWVNIVCAQNVRAIPSLQDLCIRYALKHGLITQSKGIYDLSQVNTEVARQIVLKYSQDFAQLEMLYKVPETVFAYREKCITPFLQKYAIVVCARSKKDLSLEGDESMSEKLQQDIRYITIDAVKDFITQDPDIAVFKKEKLKQRDFTPQECLWLLSFYTSTFAFADSISLDECDDALKNNEVLFDTDIKEILLTQSKKLQQMMPKYMWNLTKKVSKRSVQRHSLSTQ